MTSKSTSEKIVAGTASFGRAYANLQFVGTIFVSMLFGLFSILAFYSAYQWKPTDMDKFDEINRDRVARGLKPNNSPASRGAILIAAFILLAIAVVLPVIAYYSREVVRSSEGGAAAYGVYGAANIVGNVIGGRRRRRSIRRRSNKRRTRSKSM